MVRDFTGQPQAAEGNMARTADLLTP